MPSNNLANIKTRTKKNINVLKKLFTTDTLFINDDHLKELNNAVRYFNNTLSNPSLKNEHKEGLKVEFAELREQALEANKSNYDEQYVRAVARFEGLINIKVNPPYLSSVRRRQIADRLIRANSALSVAGDIELSTAAVPDSDHASVSSEGHDGNTTVSTRDDDGDSGIDGSFDSPTLNRRLLTSNYRRFPSGRDTR